MDEYLPQPQEKFGVRLSTKSAEVPMGFQERFLNQIGGANPPADSTIELGFSNDFEIVGIRREELPLL